MIVLQINGQEQVFEGSVTIKELLEKISVPTQAIAVAINSEIVPRSNFEKIRLRDKDRVEVIHAVGGG